MSEACELLHQELSDLPRLGADFGAQLLPQSGVYVMFERGERAHGVDRIVRVGSHSGRGGSLAQRLNEHYQKANKDRSIFRKHVGRCILAARHDPFLGQWNLDLTSRENRERHGASMDVEKLAELEAEVTEYISKCFTFVTLAVEGQKERLAIERGLLATVASCEECHASDGWLGRFHSDRRISQLGMWNIQGVGGPPLDVEGVRQVLRRTAAVSGS